MGNRFKTIFIVSGLLFCQSIFAQHGMIPLNNFYKEKFIENSGNRSLETFFPANETQLNLPDIIRDSSVQYYEFTDWLFKKHWITINKPVGNLVISPLIDFSMGKETTDKDRQRLFRNTRGLYVKGEIMDKLSFSFVFAENQARFMNYESEYFNSRGEMYVLPNGSYSRQNAVIPGGGRTKSFKTTGYDYAYSVGSIAYQANKNIRFEIGNNQHFIGSGYRSLLLSDNTTGGMNFRLNWKIAPKWKFDVLMQMNKNLYRKPQTNAIEAPYENKFYGMTYLTFQPIENLSLSLFTAGNHLRGDSIIKHALSYQMLIPVPLIQNNLLFGNSAKLNGITGLNIDFALKNTRIYSQLAVDKFEKEYLFSAQLGVHFFKLFGFKNLHLQLETNYVPQHFYADANPKLSYSHSNLPLAHPKGNNFAELVVRADYELKRLYMNTKTVYYSNLGGNDSVPFTANSIFGVQENLSVLKAKTFVQEFEIGYRFNRRYNAMLFVGWKGRIYTLPGQRNNEQMFLIGLKTGIFNQYLDF